MQSRPRKVVLLEVQHLSIALRQGSNHRRRITHLDCNREPLEYLAVGLLVVCFVTDLLSIHFSVAGPALPCVLLPLLLCRFLPPPRLIQSLS
jgi:hypothetical protein